MRAIACVGILATVATVGCEAPHSPGSGILDPGNAYTDPTPPDHIEPGFRATVQGFPWSAHAISVASNGGTLLITGTGEIPSGQMTLWLQLKGAPLGVHGFGANGDGSSLGIGDEWAYVSWLSWSGHAQVLNHSATRITGRFEGQADSYGGVYAGDVVNFDGEFDIELPTP